MTDKLIANSYVEKVDMRLLNAVIAHVESHKDTTQKYNEILNRLRWIRSEAKDNNGSFKVSYYKPNCYGRIEVNKKLSLSQIARRYRHTLCRDYYYDIDMANAAPSILYNVCLKNQIQCSKLEHYIKNRNKCLLDVMTHYNVDKEQAKKLFISLINNGEYSDWKNQNAPASSDLTFIVQYSYEMNHIINEMYTHEDNEPLVKIAKKLSADKVKKGKKSNPKGSFMSLALGESELMILEHCVLYVMEKYKTNEIILCHDGFMIPKHIVNDINSLLKELEIQVIERFKESHIFKNLDFKNKEMDEAIQIELPKTIETIIDSTQTYEELKDKFEKDNAYFYCEADKKFYKKDICGRTGDITYNPHSRSDFSTLLANMFYSTIETNGEGEKVIKKKPFFDKWLRDETRKSIKRFVYDLDPDYSPRADEINLWTGFIIEKIASPNFSDEKKQWIHSLLDRYFEAMSNDNKELKEYWINWIAYFVQYPHKKLIEIPVFQSQSGGTGKSSFYRLFASILGDTSVNKYVLAQDGFSGLTQSFNGHLRNIFLYSIEELPYEQGKKNLDFLKAFSSQETIVINEKYGSILPIPNKVRLMITTNNLNMMPVESGQRRLVITSINESLKNSNFFEDFYKMLGDIECCRYMYDWFKSLDISQWSSKKIPETTLSESLKEAWAPPIQRFIQEKATELYNMDTITNKELVAKINKWMVTNNLKEYTAISLGLQLKNDNVASKIFIYHKKNTGAVYSINKEKLKQSYDIDFEEEENECLIQEKDL